MNGGELGVNETQTEPKSVPNSAQALGRWAESLRHVAADDLGDQLHRRERAEGDRQLPDKANDGVTTG